jgi:hypothetical protein
VTGKKTNTFAAVLQRLIARHNREVRQLQRAVSIETGIELETYVAEAAVRHFKAVAKDTMSTHTWPPIVSVKYYKGLIPLATRVALNPWEWEAFLKNATKHIRDERVKLKASRKAARRVRVKKSR